MELRKLDARYLQQCRTLWVLQYIKSESESQVSKIIVRRVIVLVGFAIILFYKNL